MDDWQRVDGKLVKEKRLQNEEGLRRRMRENVRLQAKRTRGAIGMDDWKRVDGNMMKVKTV